MKKIFILSLIIILCTGCVRINSKDNKNLIINEVINSNVTPNSMAMGYKYYLPLGINKIYDKEYNQQFKYNENFIYLYVDIVSYFYKNSLNFNEEDSTDTYYYQKIVNQDKNGYIKITKENNDLYLIKIIYNYAKIESYVKEEQIEEVLTGSMIILNSIVYNDKLIEKILEDEYSLETEKEYKIDKPKDATSRFSEYLSEYAKADEKNLIDLPEY